MPNGALLNDANINGVFRDPRGLTLTLNATLSCATDNPSGTFSGNALISTFGLRQQLNFSSSFPIFIRTFRNNLGFWIEAIFRDVVVTGTSLGIEIPSSTVTLRARQTNPNRWIGQLAIINPLGFRFQGTGFFTGNLQVNRNVTCRYNPLLNNTQENTDS